MSNIEDTGKMGFSRSTVTRLSGGKFLVEFAAGGAVVSETWDIEEPEQLLFTPGGALVYVNNHGEIEEIISASALIRVKAVSA